MDRQFVKQLRERIQSVLDESEIDDVELHIGNCSYSNNVATFKLEVLTKNEDGTVNTKIAEDFKYHAFLYDLKPTDLNRTFAMRGEEYKIVGCKPRSSKYPIIVEELRTARRYKFSADVVALQLSIAS
jgi:hypothetical protein